MIEKTFSFTNVEMTGFSKSGAEIAIPRLTMEKVIDDDRVNINHIVVPPGEAVPVHVSNSWVHQIIVRGTLSMELEGEPVEHHDAGTIVAVPFNTKMAIRNEGSDLLEFFVVKAPNPKSMPPTKPI